MLSKRLSALMCGAAVAGLGTAAHAAFVIDIRAVGATGGAVLVDSKSVDTTNAAAGATVTMEIRGVVTDNDGVPNNSGVLSAAMSFLSSNGGLLGNIAATRSAQFLGTGGSDGVIRDLDGDTDLDLGSNTPSSSTGFWSARATTAPAPVFGDDVLMGTMTFTFNGPGGTAINARPRAAGTAGSWFENGTQITSSAFTAGAPVVLSVIPEPTTLGVLGVAGLGLLARRRKA